MTGLCGYGEYKVLVTVTGTDDVTASSISATGSITTIVHDYPVPIVTNASGHEVSHFLTVVGRSTRFFGNSSSTDDLGLYAFDWSSSNDVVSVSETNSFTETFETQFEDFWMMFRALYHPV